MILGIYVAFCTIFFFSLYDVFNRYAVAVVGVSPWQFALWQLLFASLTLLVFSGWGRTGTQTLKHWHTWAIGLARVISSTLFLPAFMYITATEANLLLKINIFISMALAFVFLHRKPNKKDFIGFIPITIGLIYLIAQQTGGLTSPAVWLVFGASTAITFSTILTELHPISNQSITVRARCRYTAVILAVISIIFLIASKLLSFISPTIDAYVSNQGSASFPAFIMAALIAGVFIRAPATYYSFLSIRLIKSENFLMMMSLIPFLTMSMESLLSLFNIFPHATITGSTVFAAALITGGSLFNIWHRSISHINKLEKTKETSL